MNHQYKFVTQRQLGEEFGVSSHRIGDILVRLDLRTPQKRPSRRAFEGGFVDTAPTGRNGGYFYVWDRDKTIKAMEAKGYKRVTLDKEVSNPVGPFTSRSNGADGYEIVGGDGQVHYWSRGEENTKKLLTLMNTAYDHGWFQD